jgi:uncharacterized membrane protein
MVVPRRHLHLFLKLLVGWWVVMAPGVIYIGAWPWLKAVGLASLGLALVFVVGELAFGRD